MTGQPDDQPDRPTADDLDDRFNRQLRRELLAMAIGVSALAVGLLVLLVLSLDFNPKG